MSRRFQEVLARSSSGARYDPLYEKSEDWLAQKPKCCYSDDKRPIRVTIFDKGRSKMPEDEIRGEDFTVKDRRAFDTEGKVREEEEPKEEAKQEAKQEEKAGEHEEAQSSSLPEVNFSSFILSLSSSILLHLGEIADPQSGEKKKDLALAKQTIDIITLLQEKTTGNLTEEEKNLLEHILYDMRMRFVKASQG